MASPTCEAASVAEAVAYGEALLGEVRLQEAVMYLAGASEKFPDNVEVLRVYGRALLEQGELGQAANVLGRCVQLQPAFHWEPWMNLGQLKSGHESLQCFQRGAELMQAEMKTMTTTTKKKKSNKDEAKSAADDTLLSVTLSDCYCSMAELFTTDLCEEANAEQECERLLQLALQVAPENPGALYAVTNLRLIQGDEKSASEHINKCMEVLAGLDSLDGVDHDLIANVAKACVELGRLDAAAQLFEVALQLDDTDMELWYFTALTYYKLGRKTDTIEYVTKLGEMLGKANPPNPVFLAAVQKLGADAQALPDDINDDDGDDASGADGDEEEHMEVET